MTESSKNIHKLLLSANDRVKAAVCVGALSVMIFLGACTSANCPLDNYVLCNYGFYDTNGFPVKLNDELTVTTLKPGNKQMYLYRQLGYANITLAYIDSALMDSGYICTPITVRNDTVLVNKLSDASKFSVPMSYFGTEDTIVIHYASLSSADTIYVEHEAYAHVELPECGSYRFHTLKQARFTTYGLVDVQISNPTVTYEGYENVKILFNADR